MADISTHVPNPPPKWIENFAKFGLTAKGVVYCLIGIIAFMAAFELQGKTTESAGRSGILRTIQDLPAGNVLLGIVALGLLSYAIWRFIQAFKDTEAKGSGAEGIGKRLRYLFSGLIYGAFAYLAAKIVLGSGGSGGGDSRETLVSKLLQQPFGQWLVGIVAVATIAAGLYQIYYGYSEKYKKKIQSGGLKHDIEQKMIRAGKVGYIARGVVWIVIGYLFIRAALQSNPQEAGGNTAAFQFLENSTYGSFILGAVALGLICYGVFMFMRAKYQPIHT
ncbi:DUF1206 domain-containing protein [Pontibacter akesuensis]|uniref:DUF1206 domain-containing protein n=1 Tax=Pontibacter akesuensis TaxID=388950 RepID=A0A1I7G7E6_9BACT|nr:DUF1206 domain-containing protein [Pontibacter akesuensis]GHA58406.1 hypothetical protein GCM10007389_07890 [Pontibacter akesuensis]SFU44271.1 protein of unknown function [Pontibacter akesuensis]